MSKRRQEQNTGKYQSVDPSEKTVINPVIEAIGRRKSVRLYDHKPVPRDVIETIIEAGNHAPFMSEKRFQPWRFVVVEGPEFKQKLVQATFPIWKRFMDNVKENQPEIYEMGMSLYELMDEPKDMVYYSAPVIVFVIGPTRNATCCALACENIMIAATSLGLGSCYVGFGAMVTHDADVVEALELKDDERIYGPVLLGYPKAEPSEGVASVLASMAPKKKEPKIKWT
jgi:nitroreductase